MSKQCLDVQQMQHLQELGLKLKETMLYWVVYEVGHENSFVTTKKNAMEVIDESCGMLPAYTLQDVLELLPKELKFAERRCWLRMDLSDGCVYYYYEDSSLVEQRVVLFNGGEDIDSLEAAYRILCWCIENGYVETNKTNEV